LIHGELLSEFGYEVNYIKTKRDFLKYCYLLYAYKFENIYPFELKNIDKKNIIKYKIKLAKNSFNFFNKLNW
ncbi:MAG: hypothetical protein JXQ66_01475, partial [Campylobacterales bacterium]|nr:hypothetical protein [Campylobacterales bacterium]